MNLKKSFFKHKDSDGYTWFYNLNMVTHVVRCPKGDLRCFFIDGPSVDVSVVDADAVIDYLERRCTNISYYDTEDSTQEDKGSDNSVHILVKPYTKPEGREVYSVTIRIGQSQEEVEIIAHSATHAKAMAQIIATAIDDNSSHTVYIFQEK